MALISCPECKTPNVSSTAESCPCCGYNIKAHFAQLERNRKYAADRQRVEELRRQQAADRAKPSHGLRNLLLIVAGVWLLVIILWNVMPARKYKYTCYYCGKGIDAYYLHDNHYTCNSCYRTLEELANR